MLFGTFRVPSHATDGGQWSSICAIGGVVDTSFINATGNAYSFRTPLDFQTQGTSGATCVPSALTVQIMNPNALQTTSGMIYAGVMHTQAHIGARAESWEEYFERFIEYQSPRMMAAAKLALRGVRVNSYPLSMSQVSEFTSLKDTTDAAYDYNADFPQAEGWAPILVANPSGVELEYLITTEWRVRFDLMNPAASGHVKHPMHPDSTWDRLMSMATNAGNGVRDIADIVANVGQAANAIKGMAGLA